MKLSAPKKIVLIGTSTGGPGQIQKIIHSLPKLHGATVIIAQHMVNGFIESFANRLQESSHNPISVIKDKQILESSCIYLCDGNTRLNRSASSLAFSHEPASGNSFNPDINVLFSSFIPLCNSTDIMCVILTGIGDDGVQACQMLSQNGARCVTESQESAIVDGMPSRARLLVANIEVNDIKVIIKKISEFCNV